MAARQFLERLFSLLKLTSDVDKVTAQQCEASVHNSKNIKSPQNSIVGHASGENLIEFAESL